MINFRFHLISLIAVFLALAVGVVMGYGVLGQPTVDTLQSRVDTVERRADDIRGENDQLRAEQARLESLLGDVEQFAATSRALSNEPVIPIAVRGVDSGKVTQTAKLARLAGATVPGIVWLEDKWNLESPDDAAELAGLVGSTSTAKAAIRDAAAQALANRIMVGPTTGRADLLTALDNAGFVSFEEVDGVAFDPTKLDGRSSRMLVIGGSDTAVPFARGVLPLATAFAASGRLVAVADEWRLREEGPARGDDLAAIRSGDLDDQVATVDDFDAVDGPLVAVLTLGELGQGIIGHYGFGSGADRAAPEWWGV
ncbi:MAG: copper transporter [Actinobacteria bacterium]|nr:copper transporter [Actinomycetota bacterium]